MKKTAIITGSSRGSRIRNRTAAWAGRESDCNGGNWYAGEKSGGIG